MKTRFLPTLPSLLASRTEPFIHRDLSWLQFNERVLGEARTSKNPLLERAKFLAITASNLDEFFMIRFASVERTHRHIRAAMLEEVARFTARQEESLSTLVPEFDREGLRIVRGIRAGEPEFDAGLRLMRRIAPRLTPHSGFSPESLRHLENLQTVVFLPNGDWFVVPRDLPPVFVVPRGPGRWWAFFLDDLLAAHFQEGAFLRITRDADFTADLSDVDTESIPDVIRRSVGSRERGRPMRLQFRGAVPDEFLASCMRRFRLVRGQLLPAPHTIYLHGLWRVMKELPRAFWRTRKHLLLPPIRPFVPKEIEGPDVFDRLREKDLLLHHPYDSFDAYVRWIRAACLDPHVVQIEQTLYRTDATSPVLRCLAEAAGRKKVRVIIETRARFDELANLKVAEDLIRAGAEVRYGSGPLKLHAKVTLVTRREGGSLRRYTHLSTGNYNTVTAREYEDFALLTADPGIGNDARAFLDAVWNGRIPRAFRALVAAPTGLRRELLRLIRAETRRGSAGRIVAKVNALVDEEIIRHLYRASQAGVRVDLIVRGACSLIPGVRGLSENIRVLSVVDRFLEHSRLYAFAASGVIFLSSADWMPRNFFSRLELAFPVRDRHLVRFLEQVVIPAYLTDTVKARELTPQGTWRKRTTDDAAGASVRSQFFFARLAQEQYRGTPLEFRRKERSHDDRAGRGRRTGSRGAGPLQPRARRVRRRQRA